MPAVVCNKRTIESLIKAGAFDSLGHTRRGLVVTLAVAWCALLVTRAEGLGGGGEWQLKWRWQPTFARRRSGSP